MYIYPTSDLTMLASSNVTDFSSSGVNNPGGAPNMGTAPAGSFFLLLLDTVKDQHKCTVVKCSDHTV